jgi:hypothetical protein
MGEFYSSMQWLAKNNIGGNKTICVGELKFVIMQEVVVSGGATDFWGGRIEF